MCIFGVNIVFLPSGQIACSGNSAVHVKCIFKFIRSCQNCFPEQLDHFNSTRKYERSGCSTILSTCSIISLFFKILFLEMWIFFFFFSMPCSLQDPIPWPGIKPRPTVVKVQSPNHWSTREFPWYSPFWLTSWEAHQGAATLCFVYLSMSTRTQKQARQYLSNGVF